MSAQLQQAPFTDEEEHILLNYASLLQDQEVQVALVDALDSFHCNTDAAHDHIMSLLATVLGRQPDGSFEEPDIDRIVTQFSSFYELVLCGRMLPEEKVPSCILPDEDVIDSLFTASTHLSWTRFVRGRGDTQFEHALAH